MHIDVTVPTCIQLLQKDSPLELAIAYNHIYALILPQCEACELCTCIYSSCTKSKFMNAIAWAPVSCAVMSMLQPWEIKARTSCNWTRMQGPWCTQPPG